MYPNLSGIATKDLVDKKDAGRYTADYINWARTMHMLHVHAPGWQPELVMYEGGEIPAHVWPAPDGSGYLMVRFKHPTMGVTQCWPQAVMDYKNNSVKMDQIDARDVTDTHRRGICAAAAGLFGLAYELWAKMELEDPMSAEREAQRSNNLQPAAKSRTNSQPHDPTPPNPREGNQTPGLSPFQKRLEKLQLVESEDYDTAALNWAKICDPDKTLPKSQVRECENWLTEKWFPKWIGFCSNIDDLKMVKGAVNQAETCGMLPKNGDICRGRINLAIEQLKALEEVPT